MNHGIFTRAARKYAKNARDLPSTYEAYALLDEAYLQTEPSEQTDKLYNKTYKKLDNKLAQFNAFRHAADV